MQVTIMMATEEQANLLKTIEEAKTWTSPMVISHLDALGIFQSIFNGFCRHYSKEQLVITFPIVFFLAL